MFIIFSIFLIGMIINLVLISGYFIFVRFVDIIIGSIVVIVGSVLLWRKIFFKWLFIVFFDVVGKEGEMLILMLESEYMLI